MSLKNLHCLPSKCGTLKELQQIHGQAIARGLHPHLQHLSCQILNSYARFGRTVDARNLFLEIPHPDLVSITSLISLYLQTDHPHQAISLFSEIVASGRRPDGFSIVGALSASGRIAADPRIGKSVHGLVYRHGLGHDAVVGNAMIDMYCRNGKLPMARTVFDEMPARGAVACSSMLHGYIKCQGLEPACVFFDEMPQRDTVSWTAMITGHVQGKQPVRALELFRWMKSEGHGPTLITIVGVLSACADIGALDLGRVIHGYISKTNVGSDVAVYNALIDMYAKSGNVEMAHDVFKESVYRDVFTWTTMIAGFAVHGSGKQAMEVFLEMVRAGVKPNEVTFLAVLSACSHAGFINEGQKWFVSMSRDYDISPQLGHYGCMVDLLGRAGLLSEAEKLIEEMGTEPDGVIWRSLLSACLVHGNVRLAEVAGKEIMKKEPDDDGVYVLLWNMYASSDRWEEALEMRKKMRNRNVVKKPGCSWIEIDGFVHEFLVEDKMHCHRREIFLVLEAMAKQLKMDDRVLLFQEADQE